MLKILNTSPLPVETREILALVHEITAKRQIQHLVIGATARDILLEHVFGIVSLRATRDVDFAIAIQDWKQFAQIKRELIQTSRFSEAKGREHRLYYDEKIFGITYPIDLIPFGKIEREGNQIAWPPDMHIVMSVAGYSEAMKSAIMVYIDPDLVIPVVSLPGLACLKLIAWEERRLESKKDAEDLRFILANYCDAGNNERLFGQAYGLVETTGFELELAGAALLGFDAKQAMEDKTLEKIRGILADPRLREYLETEMNRTGAMSGISSSDLLQEFERGLSLDSLDAE